MRLLWLRRSMRASRGESGRGTWSSQRKRGGRRVRLRQDREEGDMTATMTTSHRPPGEAGMIARVKLLRREEQGMTARLMLLRRGGRGTIVTMKMRPRRGGAGMIARLMLRLPGEGSQRSHNAMPPLPGEGKTAKATLLRQGEESRQKNRAASARSKSSRLRVTLRDCRAGRCSASASARSASKNSPTPQSWKARAGLSIETRAVRHCLCAVCCLHCALC